MLQSRLSQRRLCLSLLVSFISVVPMSSRAEDTAEQAKVRDLLFPYRAGTPKVDGITPGMIIDTSNVQVAKDVLPPELLDRVAAGDLSIPVQDTTNTPLSLIHI